MHQEVLQRLLHRPPESHKYDFGHVLIIGGSPGMVGAPLLAAEAALRIGCGLVTIASSVPVIDKLETRVREVMTLSLGEKDEPAARLKAFITKRKVSAIALGPGWGPNEARLARTIIEQTNIPLVIDAGGLNALENHLEVLKDKTNIVLTPHRGEFEKLLGKTLPAEAVQLQQLLSCFATNHHLTLVFKGHQTQVAHPTGSIYRNTTGNPGLATAGTGDVLSGMIAGLSAQKVALALAVETAVHLHGLAGDLTIADKTQAGLIASDVIDFIPVALRTSAQD